MSGEAMGDPLGTRTMGAATALPAYILIGE